MLHLSATTSQGRFEIKSIFYNTFFLTDDVGSAMRHILYVTVREHLTTNFDVANEIV